MTGRQNVRRLYDDEDFDKDAQMIVAWHVGYAESELYTDHITFMEMEGERGGAAEGILSFYRQRKYRVALEDLVKYRDITLKKSCK